MLSRFVVSQVKHNSYFLVGVGLGLWLALAAVPLGEESEPCGAPGEPLAVAAAGEPLAEDEYAPSREQRPEGAGAGAGAGRAVARPRYYTTELGMRAPLLAGVLSSEGALESRVAALNRTAARLLPALRFFMSASAAAPAGGGAGGRANVVGFTDAREMLKPFHALKYLADNYLDDYDFFFLVSDTSFVNARRLADLVAGLSVSHHLYMGTKADDDSHYCTLEGGILLSNSVVRAVHAELEWCVRNSYSPHHYENVGRCVLHAAHARCVSAAQGESYVSVALSEDAGGAGAGGGAPLSAALADAVTVHPLAEPDHFYRLHAYVSRVSLERGRAEEARLRAALRRAGARHPPGYRNASWPAGLRADPGLAPQRPDSRFDHARWTMFNATHAFMPDDHHAAAPLAGPHEQALHVVLEAARAWAVSRWGARSAALVEGAWRWEPAAALRYRLLLAIDAPAGDSATHTMRQVEVARPLGAARLVPVPYVTESARVTLLLPVAGADAHDAAHFLRRYEAASLRTNANTALLLVLMRSVGEEPGVWEEVRAVAASLAARHRGAQLDVLDAQLDVLAGCAGRAALAAAAAGARLARDSLVLLAHVRVEYNDDFLNRVRMNTIAGVSWYWAGAFSRFAQFAHPRFVDAAGRKPPAGTGRFNAHHADVLAFYRRDYDAALLSWAGGTEGAVADVLARSALRCVRAPEPGLVARAPAPPCGLLAPAPPADTRACLQREEGAHFARLDLGARAALAQLLLELQAESAARAA